MERDDRSPVATFFVASRIETGATISLDEAAAHHARVKRLAVGDPVRMTDGNGTTGVGTLASLGRGEATVSVSDIQRHDQPSRIHLRVPVGDRDRMLLLAEKATELGITSWQAIRFRRSMSVSPRGEGESFAAKVRARMISALEQSGGAWLPALLPDASPELADVPVGATRILLDVAGRRLTGLSPGEEAVVMFGPEGGLEPSERSALLDAGWAPVSLAPTTLRFETAGIAATAVLRAAQQIEET